MVDTIFQNPNKELIPARRHGWDQKFKTKINFERLIGENSI
jgi:hypothetical protein